MTSVIKDKMSGDTVFPSPAVADGKVLVASFDGNLYCLDATTGNFIWSFTVEPDPTYEDIYASPTVANGVVYLYCSEGTIYAFCEGVEYIIPEGLTLGVMLLLSTIAVIVSVRYFRKRQKWENW